MSGLALQGDMMPAYSVLPEHRVAEIADSLPKIQLIYIVRNPMDRAWSSARMTLRRAEMAESEASDQWFIEHFRSAGSLARGDYAATLDRWMRFYPASRFVLLRYEDIALNPSDLIMKVCFHLNLDAGPLRDSTKNPLLSSRVREGTPIPLRTSPWAPLLALYDEPQRRLRDKYGIYWTKGPETNA